MNYSITHNGMLHFGPVFRERTSVLTQMHTQGRIAKFKRKKHKGDALVEWRIPDFFSSARNLCTSSCICSPPFSLLHSTFRLTFYQRDVDIISFYVIIDQELDYPINYTISIAKVDGSVENSVSWVLKKKEATSLCCDIKYSEISERRAEFAPEDVLTVKCSFKKEIGSEQGGIKPPKLIKLEKLSNNFRQLFGDEETSDTIVKVANREYKVHRLVLIARCTVFAALFKHDTLEKETGVIVIKDSEPESFKKFLEYLYCGKVEELTFRNALSLYQISDKYDVEELKHFCVENLAQFLTVENFSELALFADKFENSTLMSHVQDFFNQNTNKILITDEWKNLISTYFELANNFLIKMPKVESSSRSANID